jgi:hypothetical protein
MLKLRCCAAYFVANDLAEVTITWNTDLYILEDFASALLEGDEI